VIANSIGFQSLVKREMVRTFSIINQVVWPPVIQTLLYVFVFGLALGSRIQNVHGVSYAQFLIPGLIMLQVIDQTYSESSSSIFQGRFMNSIQELLIAPLSAVEMLLGYVVSGVIRAIFIALLITVLGIVLVHTAPLNWGLYLLTIVLVSILFSALGIIFGLMAEKFDHIAVMTTFFITPLVFVGGVFTSTQFLPPLVQKISLVNPMFHMINAFRYSYTNVGDAPLWVSLTVVTVLTVVAVGVALRMMAVGYKLRS
jgi:ABC-2 type transport system permease protein